MRLRRLGLLDYLAAWELQKELADARAEGREEDTLLLLEHPPVYTRGASSNDEPPGPLPHPLHTVERGGDITYHGPGQLVGYPIIALAGRGLTPVTALRAYEEALIAALDGLGLPAGRLKGFTGVWSGGRKVASIGIAVRRGVSYHGFALNVRCDLAPFWRINPCLLEPAELATVSGLLGRAVPMEEAERAVAAAFAARFPAPAPLRG